jgi:hypothetical protein
MTPKMQKRGLLENRTFMKKLISLIVIPAFIANVNAGWLDGLFSSSQPEAFKSAEGRFSVKFRVLPSAS